MPPPPSNSYDEVPYASHPYPQTHPSRLFTVATLFGLAPTPVERCRVLELGAAAGGNLIPMAEAFPESEFIGIDLSARQVADGDRLIQAAGLANLTLRHASIAAVDATYGAFDYIVCHGVFSWVPADLRAKILEICRQCLTPNGIAYISYNTYPGWHVRGMVREMMRYHTREVSAPGERLARARGLLDFLARSARTEGPYPAILKTEQERLRHQADHYLYHEHLEDVNDPLYFHQFIDLARGHGLRYLGEARVETMIAGNFGPEVRKMLASLEADQIETEQYLDFLRNRAFRETLLVRETLAPDWEIDPGRVRTLHVASEGKPVGKKEPDIRSDAAIDYRTRSGMGLTTRRPLLKAAMKALADRWPGTVAFPDLLLAARALLGASPDDPVAEDDARELAANLVNTYVSSDLIELYGAAICPAAVSDRPVAMVSARAGVAAGAAAVANQRHVLVTLSEMDRCLMPLLDGTHDRAALLDELTAQAAAGGLQVQRDGAPISGEDAVRGTLAGVLDTTLKGIAGNALLVAGPTSKMGIDLSPGSSQALPKCRIEWDGGTIEPTK